MKLIQMRCSKCQKDLAPQSDADDDGAHVWFIECCDTKITDHTLGGLLELALDMGYFADNRVKNNASTKNS